MTTSHFFISAWNWNPWVIALCAVTLYICVTQLRPKTVWLVLGAAVFFLTLCSPLDALANGYLFSAHMLQHLLLLLIVPLLILLGWPGGPVPHSLENNRWPWIPRMWWDTRPGRILALLPLVGMARCAVPVAERQRQAAERTTDSVRHPTFVPPAGAGGDGAARRPYPQSGFQGQCQDALMPTDPGKTGRVSAVRACCARGRAHPAATWLLGVGGMWLWHAPTLCNAAVSNVWIHRLQSVSLLGMGCAFWWPIVGPWTRQRLAPLAGMIYLFTACLGCTILGIIITFSPVEVCSIYLHPLDRLGILPLLQNQWGLTPAKDQQLGGLLMWVPACLVYFFGILGLLARWYREPGQAAVIATAPQIPLMEKPHEL